MSLMLPEKAVPRMLDERTRGAGEREGTVAAPAAPQKKPGW
jgi:hypothetical protein